jgi:acetyl-CoA carboxylase/biotin carboxylase 1
MLKEGLRGLNNMFMSYWYNIICCSFIGYCLPDPYHQARLREVIEKFMSSLRDPSLPLLELQVGTQFR